MTEAKWLSCTSPGQLLSQMLDDPSERKKHLLGCGLCRRFLHLIHDERCHKAVETAERFADGMAKGDELYARYRNAYTALFEPTEFGVRRETRNVGRGLCMWVAEGRLKYWSFGFHDGSARRKQIWEDAIDAAEMGGAKRISEIAAICELIRCIYGNPFRAVAFDPRWRTSTVVDLADAIYRERAFHQMPILADALMDAGCDSDEVISHCRSDEPHARGCWLVDCVLEKE